MIQLDEDGDVIGTRIHPALLGPVDVEPQYMDLFYRAYRAVLDICNDESMQFVFKLKSGECQVFDNVRILHARNAFDPNSGRRELSGCYVPRDDMLSKLAILERGNNSFRLV